jgi:hypothetical protein
VAHSRWYWGLNAQRLLAMAAAIWHNWAADAPVKRH